MNSSGNIRDGFIQPIITGPEWFTGGVFGIEASYLAILLQVIIGTIMLIVGFRNNQFVGSSWSRNRN
jgi:hypothetical protein